MRDESSDRFQPGKRTRVIDFRGKLHELCEAASLPDGTPWRLRWSVRMGDRHRWVHRVRVAAAVLSLLAFLSFAAMVLRTPAGGPRWYYVTANVVSAWAAVAAVIFASEGAVKAAGRRAVEGCLKAEICPGCGYSIKGLEVDGDGSTVCPECGGAWRVGRDEV